MSTLTQHSLRSGEFLIRATAPKDIFTPEDFTEDQLSLRANLNDFNVRKVYPHREKFDSIEGQALALELLEEMGQLGFLGIGVPEEFGGIDTDFSTQLAVGELIADGHAFAVAPGIQSSLGVAPILLYGSPEQKQKYLPKIVTAETKTCYCLTEPGSGSDANAARTKAVLSEDKSHYLLNGQKMWISNSGWADVFFVFARIEDDSSLSCLIVEKAFDGITLGNEEEKMGLKGSSTRQVFFENVKVPKENLLGKRNEGFKMALNVLNTGRIKIATATSGSGKRAFKLGVAYANQRVQFNQPIIKFGAIRTKIAEMGTRLYAMESIWPRMGKMIDEEYDRMVAEGMVPLEAKYRSISEFAMECGMAKVYNTEGDSFIVDEALQIHGGMGYSSDSEIETLYRNARSNRIYEGTSEINRILTPTMLLRKVMKGKLDLLSPAMAAGKEILGGKWEALPAADQSWKLEDQALRRLKQLALMVAGQSAQKYMMEIQHEQEVLMHLADIFMEIFALESALLRSQKYGEGPTESVRRDMSRLLMTQAVDRVLSSAAEIIFALGQDEKSASGLEKVNRYLKLPALNRIEIRRRISDHFADANEYKV